MMENRIQIDSKFLEVVPFDKYIENGQLYDPGTTAIQGEQYVYPVRSRTDTRPGMYKYGEFYKFVDPQDDIDKEAYSVDNIIDFQNQTNIRGIIEQQNAMRDAERIILTTPDNIFVPNIKQDDSPVMKGLKTAVINKHIDLDKYGPRFGVNYNNDKRLFNNSTISLAKLEKIGKALDMKLTLVIEDANEDIPNPMGEKVVVELLAGDDGNETE